LQTSLGKAPDRPAAQAVGLVGLLFLLGMREFQLSLSMTVLGAMPHYRKTEPETVSAAY